MLGLFRVDKVNRWVEFNYRRINGMHSEFEAGKDVFVGGIWLVGLSPKQVNR